MSADCLFYRIALGELSAQRVYEDERILSISRHRSDPAWPYANIVAGLRADYLSLL